MGTAQNLHCVKVITQQRFWTGQESNKIMFGLVKIKREAAVAFTEIKQEIFLRDYLNPTPTYVLK